MVQTREVHGSWFMVDVVRGLWLSFNGHINARLTKFSQIL